MAPTILIDARNTAYRTVFAARPQIMKGLHPFTAWMRCLHKWLEEFHPESIHVFWDCKTSDVWRREIFEDYKGNRSHVYDRYSDFDVSKQLNRLEGAARSVLIHANVRQYYRNHQEADDLIYSSCETMMDRSIIVISSDKDLTQTMWKFKHVRIYDPIKACFVEKPLRNPVLEKALVGDKSDNIDGYRGVGPVKAKKLMASKEALKSFLEESGSKLLKRNLDLIDMARCPHLEDNSRYVQSVATQNVKFDSREITKIIVENKVSGFLSEFHDLITPLKSLV